jgi:uncharacterized protein with von Willebrand factor type A (vWA) domain
MTDPLPDTVDLADAVARFGAVLRAEGVPVGPDRCARFAQAVTVVGPSTVAELYWCALATLVSDPAQLPAFDSVFDRVFRGFVDPAGQRGQDPGVGSVATSASGGTPSVDTRSRGATGEQRDVDVPALASTGERLSTRDFAALTTEELALLADLMRELVLRTPLRRSRRQRRSSSGRRIDLRSSLRSARRTGGYPIHLDRTTERSTPRRLVVLCDISGSMQPYARAMLQLLYCAAHGPKAEAFAFATRLTRLTPALAGGRPGDALDRAGHLAPDWSGGTRIASAVREFLRDHGRRGMARGAVVLIISDGWESGDPAELATAMAALSRLAYRLIWANPRTARSGYQPLAGGMAAAWPYCDAVVSAHRLDALPELLDALAANRRR